MTTYYPDRWKVIRITHKGETYYKVFATWSESYLYGSSWKLSSGGNEFLAIPDDELSISVPQISGSIYELHKGAEGICGLWDSLYHAIIVKLNNSGAEVVELTEEQVWGMVK